MISIFVYDCDKILSIHFGKYEGRYVVLTNILNKGLSILFDTFVYIF